MRGRRTAAGVLLIALLGQHTTPWPVSASNVLPQEALRPVTARLAPGTWDLRFTATADPTVYAVRFDLR